MPSLNPLPFFYINHAVGCTNHVKSSRDKTNSLDDRDAGMQAIGLSRSENRKSLTRQDMSSETGVWTGRVRQLEHNAPRAVKGTRVSLHHSSQATRRCGGSGAFEEIFGSLRPTNHFGFVLPKLLPMQFGIIIQFCQQSKIALHSVKWKQPSVRRQMI